jgi:hypothetical protein
MMDGCMYFTDWEGCAVNTSLKYGSKFPMYVVAFWGKGKKIP